MSAVGAVAETDAPTTKRGHWGSHLQFLLSGLALAVGVGNVWRFPYIVYSNGGGSFFIPYIVTLLFVGLPILFQEMAIGQYAKVGCSKVGTTTQTRENHFRVMLIFFRFT